MVSEGVDVSIKGLGSSGSELIPGGLFAKRGCDQCLHWEDLTFWTGNDPVEVLRTKKRSWFQRVSREFNPCGMVAMAGDTVVAFAEYALPRHFPGLKEYGLDALQDVPFVACLTVAPQWQRKGVGTSLLKAVEADLKGRGYGALQSIARKSSSNNPSGPVGFWKANGFEIAVDRRDYALVTAAL